MAYRLLTALTMLILTYCCAQAQAIVADDRGGQIGTYMEKFKEMRAQNQLVVVDGLCASACTILLGSIPRERICVTPKADFAFHAAWDPGPDGTALTNSEATNLLFSLYPSDVQRWIRRNGGLTPTFINLKGTQLTEMFAPCGRSHPTYATAQPR